MGEFFVPDRFDDEPILAWRFWYVPVHDGPVALESPVMPLEWKPGQRVVAHCVEHETPAPVLDCSCGIHGASTRALLDLQKVPLSTNKLLTVVGQVSLWGKVEQHTLGYRAQYAYPYSLSVRPIGYEPDYLGQDGDDLIKRTALRLAAAYAVDSTVEYFRANR